MYNNGVPGELALGEFGDYTYFVPDRRIRCFEDRDRHVRRTGEDYTYAMLALLPQGQAWPRLIDCTNDESTLYKVHRGLADYWGFVDGRAADLLVQESDPRITLELLEDWERNWALPDPCWSLAKTIEERQFELVMWMTMLGGSSHEFFEEQARRLGYEITIIEYRPFQVGIDRCGDNRIIGDGNVPMFHRHWWWPYAPIKAPDGTPVKEDELSEWPNYGLGPPWNRFFWRVNAIDVGRFPIGDLECILDRWKPAHTYLVYSGDK